WKSVRELFLVVSPLRASWPEGLLRRAVRSGQIHIRKRPRLVRAAGVEDRGIRTPDFFTVELQEQVQVRELRRGELPLPSGACAAGFDQQKDLGVGLLADREERAFLEFDVLV